MRTRYSARAWAGFELVFRPWMGRRLDGIHVRGLAGADPAAGLPILLLANHVSWWDGFLLREVHRRLRPEAPLHVVMRADELRRVPIFRWLGAVPLDSSPMAARALRNDLRSRIADRSDAVIGYFPQGRISSAHRRPLGFRRGAAWLAAGVAPVVVVPVGLHLEPLTRPGPAAFVSVGPPVVVRDAIDPARLEAMVTAEVDSVLRWTAERGEASVDGWAGRRAGAA